MALDRQASWGFTLKFQLPAEWSSDRLDRFVDEWVHFVESAGLEFCGGVGCSPDWVNGTVSALNEAAVNATQRKIILDFLQKNEHISNIAAGDLCNLNKIS